MLEALADIDNTYDNLEGQAGYYLSNFPTGAGFKALLHYAQNMKSGGFHRYDHGHKENEERYGTKTAPEYDLTKVNLPIALLNGIYDRLADPADVEILYE